MALGLHKYLTKMTKGARSPLFRELGMYNPFKVSTFVTKLLVFSFLMASFGLSAARAQDSFGQEDQRILSQLRLKLWYQGLEKSPLDSKGELQADYRLVEELRRPMEKILEDEQR